MRGFIEMMEQRKFLSNSELSVSRPDFFVMERSNLKKAVNCALTSEFSGGGVVCRGLPALLVLFKLLNPAHVEPLVLFGHFHDKEVKDLPLLHHRQLYFGPWEALCVVAVETRLPHVDTSNEEFTSGPVRAGWEEGPFDHRQGGVAAPLGHNTGQCDILTLLDHREGGRRDGDVDGQAQIWKEGS